MSESGEREHEPSREAVEQRRQEGLAVDIAGVVRTVVGLLLLLAGAMAMCWFLLGGMATAPDPTVRERAALGRVDVAGPSLNPDQPAVRRRLRREQLERLTTYGWVDEEAGVAHVPIDAAIDRLVAEGITPPEPTDEDDEEQATRDDAPQKDEENAPADAEEDRP